MQLLLISPCGPLHSEMYSSPLRVNMSAATSWQGYGYSRKVLRTKSSLLGLVLVAHSEDFMMNFVISLDTGGPPCNNPWLLDSIAQLCYTVFILNWWTGLLGFDLPLFTLNFSNCVNLIGLMVSLNSWTASLLQSLQTFIFHKLQSGLPLFSGHVSAWYLTQVRKYHTLGNFCIWYI